MARSTLLCVSDDPAAIQQARDFAHSHNMTIQVFSVMQWSNGINDSQFRHALVTPNVLTLTSGSHGGGGPTVDSGGKLLQFPSGIGNSNDGTHSNSRTGVATINQLEAQAIEQAIGTFRGNLTEAAKALGIGRATLYRKVKQYNIDPSTARRRKAA